MTVCCVMSSRGAVFSLPCKCTMKSWSCTRIACAPIGCAPSSGDVSPYHASEWPQFAIWAWSCACMPCPEPKRWAVASCPPCRVSARPQLRQVVVVHLHAMLVPCTLGPWRHARCRAHARSQFEAVMVVYSHANSSCGVVPTTVPMHDHESGQSWSCNSRLCSGHMGLSNTQPLLHSRWSCNCTVYYTHIT